MPHAHASGAALAHTQPLPAAQPPSECPVGRPSKKRALPPCESLKPSVFRSADDIPKKKVASVFRPSSPDMLAYLDFSVSTTGILAGVKVGPLITAATRGGQRVWVWVSAGPAAPAAGMAGLPLRGNPGLRSASEQCTCCCGKVTSGPPDSRLPGLRSSSPPPRQEPRAPRKLIVPQPLSRGL